MNKFRQHIKELQHLGIPTNDMEATVAFYKKIGFEIVFETVTTEKVVFLQQGNLVVEAYENKKAALKNGAVDHICVDVDDIEAVFELAKKEGLEVIDNEIQYLPFWKNGVRFFNVLGPNKETVEFGQIL